MNLQKNVLLVIGILVLFGFAYFNFKGGNIIEAIAFLAVAGVIIFSFFNFRR